MLGTETRGELGMIEIDSNPLFLAANCIQWSWLCCKINYLPTKIHKKAFSSPAKTVAFLYVFLMFGKEQRNGFLLLAHILRKPKD